MDSILETITQQAMNYAIRSGITISASYAIRECSRLVKYTEGTAKREDLVKLQRKLDARIRILTPAIDMIELIAARGNTSLESVVSTTKAIRLDIQALGARLSRAADEEEKSKRGSSRARSKALIDRDLELIICDIKQLLERIEDAVPLVSLAITLSGVNLSTQLPSTVSPSRLLQASTFLSAGDSRYAKAPSSAMQIGPTFVLSLYMLFAGHSLRIQDPQDEEDIRETTWKEVIHKAKVKLMRVPLARVEQLPHASRPQSMNGSTAHRAGVDSVPSQGAAYEFAYQLLIIEDLDDGRVHTFDETEPHPGPYDDVASAGIREFIPIHQISKIFYADTGRILNIGTEGNSPVLLIKRDVFAPAPRRMVDQDADIAAQPYQDVIEEIEQYADEEIDEFDECNHDGPDAQLRRESSAHAEARHSRHRVANLGGRDTAEPEEMQNGQQEGMHQREWAFPPGLDPGWTAMEVYVEEADSDNESVHEDPHILAVSGSKDAAAISQEDLSKSFEQLDLAQKHVPDVSPDQLQHGAPMRSPARDSISTNQQPSSPMQALPPIKTSLSLLELLIRLTALQQFQQASHLTISDELLNFFLSEASSTGAGADSEYRRKVRRDARKRVGFDPYDESPIKLHGEDYVREHAQYYEDQSQNGHTPRSTGMPHPMIDGSRRMSTSSPAQVFSSYADYDQIASSSPAPFSPSPSVRRLDLLGRPRKSAQPAVRAPAQTRLAPITTDEDIVETVESGGHLDGSEDVLASNRNSYDSALGTSPVAEKGERTEQLEERSVEYE